MPIHKKESKIHGKYQMSLLPIIEKALEILVYNRKWKQCRNMDFIYPFNLVFDRTRLKLYEIREITING